jgi:hypothetical protein
VARGLKELGYDVQPMSVLTDGDWALVGPFIPPARRVGRRRAVDVR